MATITRTGYSETHTEPRVHTHTRACLCDVRLLLTIVECRWPCFWLNPHGETQTFAYSNSAGLLSLFPSEADADFLQIARDSAHGREEGRERGVEETNNKEPLIWLTFKPFVRAVNVLL